MLLISVVDDITEDADALCEKLRHHFPPESCLIRTYHSGNEFIRSPELSDIVIMRMEMSGLSGLEAARMMRKLGLKASLIFIADSPALAIHGYEVDAVDYLIKPVSQDVLDLALNKAEVRVEKNTSTVLALKLHNGIASIAANDIRYVEVFDHNIVYHLADGEYNVRGRLSDVYARLDPEHFILCSRSFIVNLRHVSSIHADYLMVGSSKIPVSKSHRKGIRDRFSTKFTNQE